MSFIFNICMSPTKKEKETNNNSLLVLNCIGFVAMNNCDFKVITNVF